MLDLLFSNQAVIFGAPAVIGSVFFVLRLALMLIGGDLSHGDVHADVGAGGADLHHGDPGEAFKVLSLQSVAAFLMGFGWGGLGGLHGAGWSWQAAALFGLGTGIGMVWLLAMLLRAMVSLQSSGNVAAEDAIGVVGDVYVTVPASRQGRGQVTVVVDQRQRTLDAVTEGPALPTRSRVRVTRVNDDRTVTVMPADDVRGA